MVFKKKEPKFTREELQEMLDKQEGAHKEDTKKYEEPEEIEEIEEIELENTPPTPRARPKAQPQPKVISQERANEMIDEEKEDEDTDLVKFEEDFKKYKIEDQSIIIERLQRLHRLKIAYYEYTEMYNLYGTK